MNGTCIIYNNSISAAAIAQGWSSYLRTFLRNVGVPSKFLPGFLFGRPDWLGAFTVNVMAAVLIVLCTCMLVYGIKESARFTNALTVWNVTLILVFIIGGAFYVDTRNWLHPCDNTDYNSSCSSRDSNSFFPQGISGMFRASGITYHVHLSHALSHK